MPFLIGYTKYPSSAFTAATCPADRDAESLGLVRNGNHAKFVAAHCRADVEYSSQPHSWEEQLHFVGV